MSIRRSIATAVFVAAVSAPTVLGSTPALADSAPAPTGQSQPDAPVADVPAADAPAETGPATPAPSTVISPEEEAELRARLAKVIEEPGHSRYFYEHAKAAMAGTAEDVKHFLDVEMAQIIRSDKRVRVSQILEQATPGSRLAEAASKALDGDDAAIDHFLEVEAPRLLANDRWWKVLHQLVRPGSSLTITEAAAQVLSADDAEAFRSDLKNVSDDDARLWLSQAMSLGGPEVRKAAGEALDANTSEALHTFLLTGLAEAQARDTANAQETGGGNNGGGTGGNDGNTGGTGGNTGGNDGNTGGNDGTGGGTTPNQGGQGGGTTVTPASDTTQTGTGTGTNTSGTNTSGTGTSGTGTLASTGVDAPLGTLAATGAASVALGSALVAARRRRQRQS
ncbi:ALF repeat-containing protein [Kitasatospora sp. NPDC004615]|uniref:ALF repeat-containing protein n=1 Tax=Kitasatospora sp. NPDC004615 TaxID=3364017 RepID=UPI003694E198